MSKKIFKLTTSNTKQLDTSSNSRGFVGHRPILGDTSSVYCFIDDTLVFELISGKSVNKYSGKYQSYTKLDKEYNEVVEIIKNTLKSNNNSHLPISNNMTKISEDIISVFRNNSKISNCRKSKNYSGCSFKISTLN
jgi:hypothetical protein